MNAKTKKTKVARRGKTRHGKYKVGTCKLTVTVENEVKVRVDRYAATHDYADASAFLREMISAAAETLRDFRFLLAHPAGLKELPGAPVRRFVQRYYHWKGVRDHVRHSA